MDDLDRIVFRIMSSVPDNNLFVLFGRPGFGKTTLAVQLVSRIAENYKEKALVWTLADTSESLLDRFNAMSLERMICVDKSPFCCRELEKMIKETYSIKAVVIDYFQLIEANDLFLLLDISRKYSVAIILLSQLGRGAEDNRNHKSSQTDLIQALVSRGDFTVDDIKKITKFCIDRPHKCIRNIGIAFDYDISDETIVTEYNENDICDTYQLTWDKNNRLFV